MKRLFELALDVLKLEAQVVELASHEALRDPPGERVILLGQAPLKASDFLVKVLLM